MFICQDTEGEVDDEDQCCACVEIVRDERSLQTTNSRVQNDWTL